MDTAARAVGAREEKEVEYSHRTVYLVQLRLVRPMMEVIMSGRLAQLDRALVSGTRGRGFKSHIAYQREKS